jgi:outer membrane protein OmpA-like peptidoglycan-associated protein
MVLDQDTQQRTDFLALLLDSSRPNAVYLVPDYFLSRRAHCTKAPYAPCLGNCICSSWIHLHWADSGNLLSLEAQMKKRFLTLGVAASALVVIPAYGEFKVIQKPSAVSAKPQPNPYASYSLIESDSAAPAPALTPAQPHNESRPAEIPYIRPAPEPAQTRYASTPQESEPLLSVDRLEAESDRIQAQIERLRADLEIVKVALASARVRRGGGMQSINSRLDNIEQRIADTGSIIMRIGFAPNSVKFNPDFAAAQQLLKAARTAVKITVYGHADNTGTYEGNTAVAMARAVSARNYLQAKGIHAGKIRTISRGASEPVADNNTAEGRAANRRVEVELSSRPALAASYAR